MERQESRDHFGETPFFQVNEQQRNGSGRDARDAARLPERFRSLSGQLNLHFFRQAAHLGVVEINREAQVFVGELTVDFVLLTLDVAGVFGGDFDLFFDLSPLPLRERVRVRGFVWLATTVMSPLPLTGTTRIPDAGQ